MKKYTYSKFWECLDGARCSFDKFPATVAGDTLLAERHAKFTGAIDVAHVTELRTEMEREQEESRKHSRTQRIRF